MKKKDEQALLRFSIIAPLVNKTHGCESITEFADLASRKTYDIKGEKVKFSKETIRKWYYAYMKGGYDALVTLTRNDCCGFRVLNDDAIKMMDNLLQGYPKISAKKIYEILLKEQIITEKQISLKTVQRYVKMKKSSMPTSPVERRRFMCEQPNDMWQSDTSTGPYILKDGKKYRTYLIMFLDDHSRLITGYGFYFNDNALNMQLTFKQAVKVYGVPKMLYVDNGGPYINQQLKIICARLGVEHKNTRAYDPQSKGKIERCFRTIKSQWMNSENWNEFHSLEDVNESFSKYVVSYNNTIHGSTGKRPNDAFHDYESIRKIEEDKIDAMFRHELTRTADKTRCISIEKRKYEVPEENIGIECVYTFDPQDLSAVYFGDTKCKILDEVANSKKKRHVDISFLGIVNDESDVVEEVNDGDNEIS